MSEMFKRRLRYLCINGTFAASLWYGFKVGVPWVANVATGYIGFIAVACLIFIGMLSVLAYLFKSGKVAMSNARDLREKLHDPYCVPRWVDIGFDCGVLYFLYMFGSPWALGLYSVIATSCIAMIWLMRTISKQAIDFTESYDHERELENAVSGWERDEDNGIWTANDSTPPDTFGDDDLFRMGIVNEQGEER